MFVFVLNGSFVSCEVCCSVCKAAKSICTGYKKAFLLNSMVLHKKNSKGVVQLFYSNKLILAYMTTHLVLRNYLKGELT